MTLLHIPYVFNILVLTPVALMTFLGGEPAARKVFQNKFPESKGIRTILGAQWTAILLGSVAGLFFPLVMSPILILQVIYKVLWIVVFAAPRWLTGRGSEVPSAIAGVFLAIIAGYPWLIPWSALFASGG
ncbi:MAG: hypothetical protein PVJ27_11435 [Candidatus Brocadiaceae bacterium]|jgi:hypothetical protein